MKKRLFNNSIVIAYIIFIIAVIFLSACTGVGEIKPPIENSETKKAQQTTFSKQSPTRLKSDDGKYFVTLYSEIFPIPLQKIHSWVAHIEYANGKPLEIAKIYIHGGMPEHRHNFPAKPRVRKYLGDGKFLIEGVKFNMHGNWEMRVNIKEKTQRDRAVFNIKLAP